MRTRLLSLAIVSVFVVSAQAQLPSDRFSPINYIGRFAGFGYSDGYHSCKDGQCNPRGTWKNWDPMGVTYAPIAAAPPQNTVVRSMMVPSAMSQYQYATQVMDVSQANDAASTLLHPMQSQQSSPQTFLPPQVPSSQMQSSPSDMRTPENALPPRYDILPAPSQIPSPVPAKPKTEARSIIRPSAFRY